MEHGFLDKYADLKSPVHNIEPRVKLLSLLIVIFVVALLPEGRFSSLLLLSFFSLILILISRIPYGVFIKRSLIVMPPIIALSSVYAFHEGGFDFFRFIFYTLKAMSSFTYVFILVSTTRFDRLLQSLRYFKVPLTIISILSFLYRYVFVFQDELERMLRAKESRMIKSDRKKELKILFNLAGMLFLRSLERSERIYRSMLSRGFKQDLAYVTKFRKLDMKDLTFVFLILILIVSALVMG
ncbi:MAG: cobalt ECF transporter T component CbiQ [Actinobacteria bacterium]|nr:cobalt ECF transporter T component CbiQ [Actinomycetota bacterium]